MVDYCQCPYRQSFWVYLGQTAGKCGITVALTDAGSDYAYCDITTPCGVTHKGCYFELDTEHEYNDCEPQGITTVKCTKTDKLYAYFSVCYEKSPVVTCGDYNNMYDCHQAGCYWYDGICHQDAQPEPRTPLEGIGDWFYAIQFPLLGEFVFRPIASLFYEVQSNLDAITDMISGFLDATGIVNLITQTFDIVTHQWSEIQGNIDAAIKGLSDIVTHKWSDVVNLIPSWDDLVPSGFPASVDDLTTLIKNHIPELPSWFPASVDDLTTLIMDIVRNSWSLFGATASTIVTQGKDTIKGWFPYDFTDAQAMIDWLGITVGDVIGVVLDTPAKMVTWLHSELESRFAILAKTVHDLKNDSLANDVTNALINNQQWQDTKWVFALTGKKVWSLFNNTAEELASAIKPFIPVLPDNYPTSLSELYVLITSRIPPWPAGIPTTLSEFEMLVKGVVPPLPAWFPTSYTDFVSMVKNIVPPLPSWFPISKANFDTMILTLINSTWGLFGDTASTIVTKGKQTVLAWFPYDISDAQSLLRWIGIEAGDVITTILDTPGDMLEWLHTEIETRYTIVLHTWAELLTLIPTWKDIIPPGFPTSLVDLTALIEEYAPSLPSWFPTSIEKFKDAVVGWIAERFGDIMDIVFKEK